MPTLDDFIGKRIDDFLIEERIGQGAMAVVYRAFQPSINRHVALKVIRLDEGQGLQEEFRRRFAREAEVIAQLEHIHILPIYAYGIGEEMAYLAMRWLRGGSLSELMRQGRIPLVRTADLFKQIAQGLAYAHSRGVIHRDLKPSNIMLDDAGNAYLTDFGLAKLTEGSVEITRSGTIVGTPAYMSPEQLRGEPLDHRSDIYSLGVILYNMVVGRLPFDTSSTDLVSIIYQHLEKPPKRPTEVDPSIPLEVEGVILRALEKDREKRFSNAEDMARALNLALGRPIGSSDHIYTPRQPSTLLALRGLKLRRVRARQMAFLAGFGTFTLVAALLLTLIFVLSTVTPDSPEGTQTAAAWTATPAPSPTPFPQATVVVGDSGSAALAVPTDKDITVSKARLGANGFIAYIACTQDTEYHGGLARELLEFATEYGLALRVYDGQTDPYRQITLIERARVDGATALIVCPLNADLLSESLADVQQAGMPLVLFADKMPSYGGVLVGGDNYLLGLEPGQYAGQLIENELGGNADVIILDFPDRPDIVARANGLEDGILSVAPRANIIGRFRGATREFARESVSQLIADGVHFDVIVSINDAGSFGAIEAMEVAGFDPSSVIIVSIDAEVLAQQYIRDDYFMRGSVQSSRDETAHTLIDVVVKLLAGATLPESLLVPPGTLITREVLEEATAEP